MMISLFSFSDDVSKDCFSDDVKTAIWLASVPILDGWHGQAHPIVGTLARAPEPYNLVVTVLF